VFLMKQCFVYVEQWISTIAAYKGMNILMKVVNINIIPQKSVCDRLWWGRALYVLSLKNWRWLVKSS
jgi:hypothetical protein